MSRKQWVFDPDSGGVKVPEAVKRRTEEVDAGLQAVRAAAASLGCPLATPFMTLSFISLPSIPEAGISDWGLIDVRNHALIPVVVQE